MKAAQELYEGVEIEGMGAIGLITYMRTDSLRISEDAIKDAADLYRGALGQQVPARKAPRTSRPSANAQDGHEAIRPYHRRA